MNTLETSIVPAAGDGALQLGSLAVNGPKQLVVVATEIARELARVIEDRGLAIDIKGRPYVKVEGWTTCAAMMGITAREVSVEELDDGSFVAVVELARVADGRVIGRGSALCSPEEPTWKGKPRYAIRSMSITRATGKACRLAFSWIMTLAGYQATPAEEAGDLGDERGGACRTSTRSRQRKPAQQQRVLGQVGADRLLQRLDALGRSFTDLLNGLRAHEPDSYPLCTGCEVADISADAMEAIARQLERFAQDETEPVIAASGADEISEDDIPF